MAQPKNDFRCTAGLAGLLFLAALAIYWPVGGLGFVNYDDDLYVTANSAVQGGLSGASFKWAFTHFHAANWHPLTWLSHMLDVQLYGLHSAGHHITNAVLHACATFILFLWLRSVTRAFWQSAFVAALFAVHPLHVESVAWVAERKDVLSACFGLLSLWAYTTYARTRKAAWYLAAFFLLACGLMSKPMLVTWPCVMLLLDFWPLQRTSAAGTARMRWPALIIEKIPFLLLSLAASITTYLAQKSGEAIISMQTLSLGARVANAFVGYLRYLGKTIWPENLAVIYPVSTAISAGLTLLAALVLLAVTGLAFSQRKARPYLLVGWLWFVGTLVPVIGIVQVGNQSIADRYMYLPSIGLFIALVWGMAEIARRSTPARLTLAAAGSCALIACIAIVQLQLRYWKNSETLFRRALAVTRDNFVAWNNLGFFLAQKPDPQGAADCYAAAVKINPSFENAWYNLGCALADLGRNEEAITAFETALRLNPRPVKTYNNLAAALAAAGRPAEAADRLRAAARLNPQSAQPHSNLGALLASQENWQGAIAEFSEAARLDPNLAEAQCGLAGALAKLSRYDEASSQLVEFLKGEPGNLPARLQLAGILSRQGKPELALQQYTEAVRANPGSALAQYRMAALLAQQHQTTGAITHYRAALQLQPGFVEAMNNLAWLLATSPDAQYRNGPEAVQLAEQACQQTGNLKAFTLGTLAAAYAASGRFPDAVATGQKAMELAQKENDTELVAKTASLIELYRDGKPYRDVPSP